MKELLAKIPEPLKEGLKEFGRVILLSIIPLLISYLDQGIGIDMRAIFIVGALAGLRFVDKWLHETGNVLEENETVASPLTGGLTRF